MKMMKLMTGVCLAALFVGQAEAKVRKMITVEQPSVVSCMLVPFPGTACPLYQRVIGSGLWGVAIGVTAGSALATGAVVHAVAYGTAVGAGVGAASPVIFR